MKKLVTTIMLFILTIPTLNVLAGPIARQQLVKGQAVSIETEYDIGDVAVSDHNVCDFMITDDRREIYLNPRQEGAITLTIWDGDGKKRDIVPVEVYGSDLTGVAGEAKALFMNTNIRVDQSGRRVVLSGEATSKVELEQAASLAARYPEIENNVTMSREVLQTVASTVEKAIATPGVKVRNVRGRLVLEGVVYSGAEAKRVVEIAGLYDPNILDLMEVKQTGRRPGMDKLVKLNVYFMEVKKEALRSLGIRWSPGSMPKEGAGPEGGGLFSGLAQFGSTILGFVLNFIPRFKILRERGEARVLDSASLIVKSAEAADLFSGTQVPYYSGEQVVFKDVGISLHAEPIVSGNDVDLVVKTTLSSLAANIEGGIDTRTVSTSAYVRAGYSIALANVISNRDVKTYNKAPSDLNTSSAIFNLVASKDFQTGRSEFVIFIEPEILEQASTAEEKLREYLSLEEDMIGDRSKDEYLEFMEAKGRVPKQKYMKSSNRRRKSW